MDRRQFLVSLGGAGLSLAVAAAIEACGSPPSPIRPSGSVPRSSGAPSATTPATPAASTASGGPASNGPPPSRDTAIAIENRRRGDRRWDLRRSAGRPVAQAFTSAVSAAPGDTLDLHLDSHTEVDVEWYRLGWYHGAGGRLVQTTRHLPPNPAGPPTIDAVTGRAEAPFSSALSITIPSDWPSGLYLAVVRPPTGTPGSAPFVVRPAPVAPVAPVLFVSAVTTWQAYNAWGGADLYGASIADTPQEASGRRAVQVSFDRPYLLANGAGYLPRWELPFVRWQEREGRAVDYCADVDLELHPELVTGRRLLVFAGHHEYWSRPMRATLEAAIASGVNVAFLSANEIFWQVRLEPSPLGPARRVTCYKSLALDPLAASQPDLTTVRWRAQPLDAPEAVVVGQMYGHIVRRVADWVVVGSDHWLYEGTGLRDGDHLVNLIGQEYDTFFPQYAPPGTKILARSPVEAVINGILPGGQPADPNVQTATIYTADSGATVFAAGTFQWSWALDGYGDRSYRGVATPRDERVVRMTRNLFDRLGDGAA